MSKRLHELDSLRGIAAFSVMLSHVFLVYPIIWHTDRPTGAPLWLKIFMFSPMRVAWAGHEAVIFFFVLSGFVLALLFFGSGESPAYRHYLIKRIIRIYPPYLASALLAIGLREIFFNGPILSASGWFNESWQHPVTANVIANHVLMIGSFRNGDFNPVLWSLVHEMRISIIFPLIIWALIRHEKLCLVLPVLFTFIFWLAGTLSFRGAITFNHDYFATLHYTGFFIVGGMLAKHRERLIRWFSQIPKHFKWLILTTALAAYSNAFWLPYYGGSKLGAVTLLINKSWLEEWITATGVIIFMIMALSSGAVSGVLTSKPLQFLGAISYSLYLFHALTLKAIVTLLIPFMPLSAVLGTTVVCALVVSTASWRFIEVPCIRLGRNLTRRARPTAPD